MGKVLGLLVRPAGENLVVCSPYIVEKEHIDRIVNVLADAIAKHAWVADRLFQALAIRF